MVLVFAALLLTDGLGEEPGIVLHASMNLWTPVAVPTGTIGQLAVVLVAKTLLVGAVVMAGLTPKSPSPPVGALQQS